MIKRLVLFTLALLAALAPADAWIAQKASTVAPKQQTLVSGGIGFSTGDYFIPLSRFAVSSATTGLKLTVFPIPGKLKSISAWTTTNPGAGKTFDFTVQLNDSDTALTCQIASTSSGTCTFATDVTVTAGQWAVIKIHPTSSPDPTYIQTQTVFEPTTPGDTMVNAYASSFSNATEQATHIGGADGPGALATRRYPAWPDAGTLDLLTVATNAPGAGKQYTYYLAKDGSRAGSPPSCVNADTSTGCASASNSQTVVATSGSTAGSDIQFDAVPSPTDGTTTASTAGLAARYVSSTLPGAFVYMYSTTFNADNATAPVYCPLSGSGSEFNCVTTEGNSNLRMKSGTTFKALAVSLTTAPGAAASGLYRDFFLRKNGADTGLTCRIFETEKACIIVTDVATADNDTYNVSDVPSAGSPATGTLSFALLANRP